MIDKDNQGGFIIPRIYFNPKKGYFYYLCRKIGKWLFLLGHNELHPYADLLKMMTSMEITRK